MVNAMGDATTTYYDDNGNPIEVVKCPGRRHAQHIR